MNHITKMLLALALCAFAAVAFAGQENKTPAGGKGGKDYGQQQQQQAEEQAKQQEQDAQQQGDDQGDEGQQRSGDEQPE